MVELMKTKTGLVGFRAHGTAEKQDITQIMGALDVAAKRSDSIAFLGDLRNYEGMTPQALLTDLYEGLQRLDKVKKISRAAVITEKPLLKGLVGLEDKLFPDIDLRTFDGEHADEARRWVGEN